jgi:hypothetical protein
VQDPNAQAAGSQAPGGAAAAVQQHMLPLQQEVLLQGQAPTAGQRVHSNPATEAATSGSTGFLTAATELDGQDLPAGTCPAAAHPAGSDDAAGSYTSALTTDTAGAHIAQAQAAQAAAAACDATQQQPGTARQQQPSSWPRVNLQDLLRMDSSDSEAVSGECSGHNNGSGDAAAWGGSCSGSPRKAAQEAVPLLGAACDDDSAGSQDSPPLQQQGAASRFSFAGAAQQAVPLQYITPLKIPQPPGKHAWREEEPGGRHASGSSRSSSAVGSYMEGLHNQRHHDKLAAGKAHAALDPQHSMPAASQHRAHDGTQAASSRPGSSPVSNLLSPSAASSMSSEAAALLQALKLAAEQRRITQGVLTARSSLTSGLLTEMRSGGPTDQPTPASRPQLPAPTAPTAAAAATPGQPVNGTGSRRPAQLVIAQPDRAPASGQADLQRQQQLRSVSPSPRSSPGGSVQGPLGPLPRSNSVLQLQRSAAERLLQDALDSSSFSSLMALLDSAAGSEDEGEVQQQQQQQEQLPPQQQQHVESGGSLVQQQAATAAAAGARSGPDSCRVTHPTGATGPAASQHANVAAAGGAAAAPVPRRTSIPESHSTWGSCFSTPLGGNSRVFSPKEGAQPEQGPQGASQAPQQQQQQWCDAVEGVSAANAQPSPPLVSAVSGVGSELVSEALSTELQQLQQQVESERQQLSQLQQQRSMLELQALTAATEQQVQRPSAAGSASGSAARSGTAPGVVVSAQGAAGGVADEVSPQSVYLDCTDQTDHQHDSQQQQHGAGQDHTTAAAVTHTADVAVQCECSWLQHQVQKQMGQVEASAQGADAACQAVLLHVSGLPAVGPPIECRACPVLQKQLRDTQQRLEAALEQHKQVRHGSARLTTRTVS